MLIGSSSSSILWWRRSTKTVKQLFCGIGWRHATKPKRIKHSKASRFGQRCVVFFTPDSLRHDGGTAHGASSQILKYSPPLELPKSSPGSIGVHDSFQFP